MANFDIIKLYDGDFSINGNGDISKIMVYIPENPDHVTTKEARKAIESDLGHYKTPEEKIRAWRSIFNGDANAFGHPFRWPAGGLGYSIGDDYAIFLLRDEGAPTYPNHLTVASGLGKDQREIYNPYETIIREGVEEIAFAKEGKIYSPAVINHLPDEKKESLTKKILENAKKYDIYASKLENIGSELAVGDKKIDISYDGGKKEIYVPFINLDPRTNGIDSLGILNVYVDINDIKSKKIRPIDSEGFGRDIVIVPTNVLKDAIEGLPYKAIIVHSDGKVEEKDVMYPLTPTAVTATQDIHGLSGKDQILRELDKWEKELA